MASPLCKIFLKICVFNHGSFLNWILHKYQLLHQLRKNVLWSISMKYEVLFILGSGM